MEIKNKNEAILQLSNLIVKLEKQHEKTELYAVYDNVTKTLSFSKYGNDKDLIYRVHILEKEYTSEYFVDTKEYVAYLNIDDLQYKFAKWYKNKICKNKPNIWGLVKLAKVQRAFIEDVSDFVHETCEDKFTEAIDNLIDAFPEYFTQLASEIIEEYLDREENPIFELFGASVPNMWEDFRKYRDKNNK